MNELVNINEEFLKAIEDAVTCQRSRGGICEICRVNLRNSYEKIVGEDWERREDFLLLLNAGSKSESTLERIRRFHRYE